MKKALIVVDMQNDFVSGSLGTEEAQAIVGQVAEKIRKYEEKGADVIFTRDTHGDNYLETMEGKKLPVKHCIQGSHGWEIIDELKPYVKAVMDKPTFGSTELVEYVREQRYEEIELVGLCTDICVVSNALLLKANFPEMEIKADEKCCAGVTPESHNAAIETMKMCQITIEGRED